MKTIIIIMLLEVFAVCSFAQDRLSRMGGYVGGQGPQESNQKQQQNPGEILCFQVDEIKTNGVISRTQKADQYQRDRKNPYILNREEVFFHQSVFVSLTNTSDLVTGDFVVKRVIKDGILTNKNEQLQIYSVVENQVAHHAHQIAETSATTNKPSVSFKAGQGLRNTDTWTPHRKLGQ